MSLRHVLQNAPMTWCQQRLENLKKLKKGLIWKLGRTGWKAAHIFLSFKAGKDGEKFCGTTLF